jgi:hypothetical protein
MANYRFSRYPYSPPLSSANSEKSAKISVEVAMSRPPQALSLSIRIDRAPGRSCVPARPGTSGDARPTKSARLITFRTSGAPRLLRSARNDIAAPFTSRPRQPIPCHCEEHSDEAISMPGLHAPIRMGPSPSYGATSGANVTAARGPVSRRRPGGARGIAARFGRTSRC